jgi:hypothetical protein
MEVSSALGVPPISMVLDGFDFGLDLADGEEWASDVEGFGKFMAVKDFEDEGALV